MLIPTRAAEDLFAGWWQLIAGAGGGAAGAGLGRRGRGRAAGAAGGASSTADCQAFRGTLGAKVLICQPRDPEAKGLVERAHDYLETLVPARPRRSPSPADFNTQLAAWLALANTRRRRALGCAPTDRIDADRAGDAGVAAGRPGRPGGGPRLRLPRDHYVRLDGNDYSVHPAVIGRRVEVVADLDRVRVFCDGPAGRRPRPGAGPGTRPSPTPSTSPPRTRCAATGSAVLRPVAADPRSRPRGPDRLRHRASGSRRRRGWRDGPTRTATKTASRDVTAEVAFLTRALKAPTLREAVARLAERARAESWTHEEFLVACLQREVSARESHGGEGRIRAARFPARKIAGGVRLRPRPRPQTRRHRPPGHPGLRHRQGERGVPRPARHRQDPPGHRAGDPGLPGRAPGAVRHRRRSGSPGSPTPTTPAGCRPSCVRLGRYPLLVVDEVGYIPFEPEAANLFFQLVSSRYERASLIVTSNKPFGRWGEVFGDDVVAAAMIDRLVHHAEVVALKGDSYRLKDRDLGRVPAATTEEP